MFLICNFTHEQRLLEELFYCSNIWMCPKQQSQIEGSSITLLKDRHVRHQLRNRCLGILDSQTLDPQTLDQATPDPKSLARDSKPPDSPSGSKKEPV